ncbi:hypothetical protein [Photorhabdus bodei]|uniref:Uncharacterized protein n=1 Tax=Photorhabdus bodei TaxID=2029681 RepID=A0ABX0AFR6_9GAMM|nr:hypothetical protein [Photorhabdus bodei]NDK97577.1 hypothetical protein [Photorhabdus bodei]NDL01826.1 hypothetical protein [Photorhabdus bodei]NDL06817.1 hypothetical protein [Photorhabdus bodei]
MKSLYLVYLGSLQPQRFSLPIAEAFSHSHIALPHHFLLAEETDMLDVQRALDKVMSYAEHL